MPHPRALPSHATPALTWKLCSDYHFGSRAGLLAAIVDELGTGFRLPPAAARAQARLAVAVTRGLLLDLLATGDRAGTDAAMRQFVVQLEPR